MQSGKNTQAKKSLEILSDNLKLFDADIKKDIPPGYKIDQKLVEDIKSFIDDFRKFITPDAKIDQDNITKTQVTLAILRWRFNIAKTIINKDKYQAAYEAAQEIITQLDTLMQSSFTPSFKIVTDNGPGRNALAYDDQSLTMDRAIALPLVLKYFSPDNVIKFLQEKGNFTQSESKNQPILVEKLEVQSDENKKLASKILLEHSEFFKNFFARQNPQLLQTKQLKRGFRVRALDGIDSTLKEAIQKDCKEESIEQAIQSMYDQLSKKDVDGLLDHHPAFFQALVDHQHRLKTIFQTLWKADNLEPYNELDAARVVEAKKHFKQLQANPPKTRPKPQPKPAHTDINNTQKAKPNKMLIFLIVLAIVSFIAALTVATCGFGLLSFAFLLPASVFGFSMLGSILECSGDKCAKSPTPKRAENPHRKTFSHKGKSSRELPYSNKNPYEQIDEDNAHYGCIYNRNGKRPDSLENSSERIKKLGKFLGA